MNRAVLSGPTPQLGRILVAITDAINGPLLRLLPRKQLISMTLKSLNVPDAFRPLVEADLQQLTPALYRHINQATGAVSIPTQPVPPTLVVVGEKEPGVSRRHAQKLGREVPGVTARLVPGRRPCVEFGSAGVIQCHCARMADGGAAAPAFAGPAVADATGAGSCHRDHSAKEKRSQCQFN